MNSKTDSNRRRYKMDGETAMAFAGHQFEQLHPRHTCPDWLPRCTTLGYTKKKDECFVVYFTVTKKGSDQATVYFSAQVDARTAKVTVLIDIDPTSFEGHELIGY